MAIETNNVELMGREIISYKFPPLIFKACRKEVSIIGPITMPNGSLISKRMAKTKKRRLQSITPPKKY